MIAHIDSGNKIRNEEYRANWYNLYYNKIGVNYK